MKSQSGLTFKVASEESEFQQIHDLNYRTFVEELPQHEPNAARKLVDRFHEENTYMICLQGRQLRGMVAIRSERPFSLDGKLQDLDSLLPPARSICEIRLLSVENGHRGGRILRGLLGLLMDHYEAHGHDLVIVSAACRQLDLYSHMGFVPFGSLVGTPDCQFQPMYATDRSVKRLKGYLARLSRHQQSRTASGIVTSFLPGPVNVGKSVREAFAAPPVSHRSKEFAADFEKTRLMLCELVKARHVQVISGSGTLANDLIAGQLSLNHGRGLILKNGEFGERLVDHAARLGLSFDTLTEAWGNGFDRRAIQLAIDDIRPDWVWFVHCETSTGILNDLEMLKIISTQSGVMLCADCISSIGTIPVNLRGVSFASCVSGKGLASYPGLAMVFYNDEILASRSTPRYLDLGLFAAAQGIPFTISSNLVYALKAALEERRSGEMSGEIAQLSATARERLREMGFRVLGEDNAVSPAVITLVCPAKVDSERLGRKLEEAGYALSYRSPYLVERNYLQVCLMGEVSRDAVFNLLDEISSYASCPGAVRESVPVDVNRRACRS